MLCEHEISPEVCLPETEHQKMTCLEALANLASIITAIVAAYAYGAYRFTIYQRRAKLEKLLESKSAPNDDSLTVQQLSIALALTEDQVIESASRSKVIETWAGQSGNEYRFKLIRKSK
jgi:hypothetical protein